jgi:hypothetical protein
MKLLQLQPWQLQQALENAGIIFIDSDGVRLTTPRRGRAGQVNTLSLVSSGIIDDANNFLQILASATSNAVSRRQKSLTAASATRFI